MSRAGTQRRSGFGAVLAPFRPAGTKGVIVNKPGPEKPAAQQKPAAPAAPTAPPEGTGEAAPTAKPSPWSALYEQRVANAQNRTLALNPILARQEQSLSSEFGYGYDPAGNLVDNVDNPFSRAMQLREAFRNRQRAGTNSAAARGQLYSGAAQNTQNMASRDYLKDVDANKRAFDASWQALQDKRLEAKQAETDDIQQAAHDKLYDDLNSTPTDPGVTDWSAAEALYNKGKWAKTPNPDGSRNYLGTDGKVYKIWPDKRRELA